MGLTLLLWVRMKAIQPIPGPAKLKAPSKGEVEGTSLAITDS